MSSPLSPNKRHKRLALDLYLRNLFALSQPHPSLDDVLIVRENEYCKSEKVTIFMGVIYAYKGLLLVSKEIQ